EGERRRHRSPVGPLLGVLGILDEDRALRQFADSDPVRCLQWKKSTVDSRPSKVNREEVDSRQYTVDSSQSIQNPKSKIVTDRRTAPGASRGSRPGRLPGRSRSPARLSWDCPGGGSR